MRSMLIKAAAKAIQDRMHDWLSENGSTNDTDLGEAVLDAILVVLEEPSEEMVRAGAFSAVCDDDFPLLNPSRVWRVMLQTLHAPTGDA